MKRSRNYKNNEIITELIEEAEDLILDQSEFEFLEQIEKLEEERNE